MMIFRARALTGLGVLFLAGCAVDQSGALKRHDVSDDPQWWGALHRGQIVVLKRPLLARRSTQEPAHMAVSIPISQSPDRSMTVQKALHDDQWRKHVVPAGTRLRCDRLFRVIYFPTQHYEMECTIVSGSRAGDRVITQFLATGTIATRGSLQFNEIFARPE